MGVVQQQSLEMTPTQLGPLLESPQGPDGKMNPGKVNYLRVLHRTPRYTTHLSQCAILHLQMVDHQMTLG